MFLLVTLVGCSVEKNTSTTRFYHSLTSRFNIYFNANESFKAGEEKITRAYKDDYSELLRVFEYSDPEAARTATSDMNIAIQKASKIITLKSITAKPESGGKNLPDPKNEEFLNRKEYNEWVEKSYLLMGKARLYMHEFEIAKSTLGYNISYSSNRDVITESKIWLARAYTETGNFNEAKRILQETDISNIRSKHILSTYYTTVTDLDIRQKNYNEAAENLQRALKYVSGKRNRIRLTYLLAQLYEKIGNYNSSALYYKKVIKMNPPYEVEFYARINLAGAYNPSQGTTEGIRKELEKMIRSPKNSDYLDLIYYTIAGLYRKEGKDKEAGEYFKKSASSSTSNKNQKGKAFLALADYYFSIPDYLLAGKYYDSAVIFLDQKYPDYQSVKTKAGNLNSLISQLLIIQREDSLQKVARMSPAERNILIATIIDDVRRAEAEAISAGQTPGTSYNLGQYFENERRFQPNIEQEGKWYFYNQAALTFGRTEFRRRWGDRKLEDNWRRANKARASFQVTDEQQQNGNSRKDEIPPENDNKKPEFYLRNLPLNDSLMTLSNKKIALALLEAGKIYYENFADASKASETLETLINRFPDSSLESETLYTLYNIHKETNNIKSEIYRQKLIQKYPESEYTRIITDPSYFSRKFEETRLAEKLYEQAFEAWQKEDFSSAISLCNKGLSEYCSHELAPKFQLLKSYCIARTENEKAFKDELGKVTGKWPGTPEATRAQELIAFLNQEIPELKIEEEKQIAVEIYSPEKDSQHLFALIIMDPTFNINQATFDVISYNIDNYTNRNFRTAGALVENKFLIITVSGFKDMNEAMDYYRNFNIEKEIRNTSGAKMFSFIIGSKNLEALEKDKNPERYLIWFKENYLN